MTPIEKLRVLTALRNAQEELLAARATTRVIQFLLGVGGMLLVLAVTTWLSATPAGK